MFTEKDYEAYLDEISEIYKRTLVIYTDILNEIDSKAVKSKLQVLARDNMEAFRFVRDESVKFRTER